VKKPGRKKTKKIKERRTNHLERRCCFCSRCQKSNRESKRDIKFRKKEGRVFVQQKTTYLSMKPAVSSVQKRGTTPSAPKNNQGTVINVTRKIVDANVNNQPKKQIVVPTCKIKSNIFSSFCCFVWISFGDVLTPFGNRK